MCNIQYKTTFSVTSHCNLAVEEKINIMMEICLLLLLKLQSNLGYRDSLGLGLIASIIESLDKKKYEYRCL